VTTFEELKRKSAWPPASNGMPHLGDDYPDTLLWQYFTASESLDGDLHSLAVNLTRLSDKAIREYRAASDDLTAFLDTPRGVERLEGHTRLLRATDHLENCIDAIRRAEGFFDTSAFKRVTTAENREMLKELHRGLRKIRNSIQHAEDRFPEGRIPEGDPLFPAMTSDCLYFAREYISYAEIAALAIIVWQLANVGIKAVTTR
jgi:hypothetical protein